MWNEFREVCQGGDGVREKLEMGVERLDRVYWSVIRGLSQAECVG